MNLLLLPILGSAVLAAGFAIPIMIGGAMQFGRTTARVGRSVLFYSSGALLGGVAGCWIGFGLMLVSWSWERHALVFGNVNLSLPVAIFWVSVPCGILIGASVARGFLDTGAGGPVDRHPVPRQPS